MLCEYCYLPVRFWHKKRELLADQECHEVCYAVFWSGYREGSDDATAYRETFSDLDDTIADDSKLTYKEFIGILRNGCPPDTWADRRREELNAEIRKQQCPVCECSSCDPKLHSDEIYKCQ